MIKLFPKINQIIISYNTSWLANMNVLYILPRKHFLLACGQLTIIIISLKNYYFSQKTSHGWYSFNLWVKCTTWSHAIFIIIARLNSFWCYELHLKLSQKVTGRDNISTVCIMHRRYNNEVIIMYFKTWFILRLDCWLMDIILNSYRFKRLCTDSVELYNLGQ